MGLEVSKGNPQLLNGDFNEGLNGLKYWRSLRPGTSPHMRTITVGTLYVGKRGHSFYGTGPPGCLCLDNGGGKAFHEPYEKPVMIAVAQDLQMDVSKCQSLVVELDVVVLRDHPDPGCGAVVSVSYVDEKKKKHVWGKKKGPSPWWHGFVNPAPSPVGSPMESLGDALEGKRPAKKGPPAWAKEPSYTVLKQGEWNHYTSPNLMLLSPKPKLITELRLYGNSRGFDACWNNARLTCR